MTVYCAACGKPNTDQASNCASCGEALKRVKPARRFKGTMMMNQPVISKPPTAQETNPANPQKASANTGAASPKAQPGAPASAASAGSANKPIAKRRFKQTIVGAPITISQPPPANNAEAHSASGSSQRARARTMVQPWSTDMAQTQKGQENQMIADADTVYDPSSRPPAHNADNAAEESARDSFDSVPSLKNPKRGRRGWYTMLGCLGVLLLLCIASGFLAKHYGAPYLLDERSEFAPFAAVITTDIVLRKIDRYCQQQTNTDAGLSLVHSQASPELRNNICASASHIQLLPERAKALDNTVDRAIATSRGVSAKDCYRLPFKTGIVVSCWANGQTQILHIER